MFCTNCGNKIEDNAVCPFCGFEQRPAEVPDPDEGVTQLAWGDGGNMGENFLSPQPDPVAESYPQPEPVVESYPQPEPYPPFEPSAPAYPEAPAAAFDNGGYPQTPDNWQPAPSVWQPAPAPQAPVPIEEPKPKKKKTGLIVGLIAGVVVLLAGAAVLVFFLTADSRHYNRAMDLKNNGEYQEAIEIFTELSGKDYEDSAAQITDCQYLAAKQKLSNGKFDEAIEDFTALGDYKDSRDMITECRYQKAQNLLATGKYTEAIAAFENLGDYKDSVDMIPECHYQEAKHMMDEGQYADAAEGFRVLDDYKDSADLKKECDYLRAKQCYDEEDYKTAKSLFESLGDYEDSKDLLKACNYAVAKEDIESNPSNAISLLEDLGDYEDSADLLKDAKMNYCKKNDSDRNETTYKYLKELVKANYPGAKDFYDNLYTYKITHVYWNTSADNHDESSGKTKISSSDKQVLHFQLDGGTPDDTDMDIYYVVTWPGGNSGEGHFTGRTRYYTLELTNSVTGKVKVDLYTKNKKKKLYTATVTVV